MLLLALTPMMTVIATAMAVSAFMFPLLTLSTQLKSPESKRLQ